MCSVVEGAYGAIVQSGGHYNLALYASNTSHKLAFDTIICSIGTKYKVRTPITELEFSI